MQGPQPLESYRLIVTDDTGSAVGQMRHTLHPYGWEATAFCCGRTERGLATFFDALAFIEDDLHDARGFEHHDEVDEVDEVEAVEVVDKVDNNGVMTDDEIRRHLIREHDTPVVLADRLAHNGLIVLHAGAHKLDGTPYHATDPTRTPFRQPVR